MTTQETLTNLLQVCEGALELEETGKCPECKFDVHGYRHWYGCDFEDKVRPLEQLATMKLLLGALLEYRKTLDGILSNVALDWYVEQFSRDESAKGFSTGIAAKIHNNGVKERAANAFQQARETIASVDKSLEKIK